MGSRMMHLIIAEHVSEKLKLKNKHMFLLGGIAPDAVSAVETKAASHYFGGSLDDGTRFVDYKRFVEKYPLDVQTEYGLGYLTHLISDDVWLKHVYFENNLKNRVDADPALLYRWHRDFRKLNGRLIDWFGCGNLKTELMKAPLHPSAIGEIEQGNLQRFIEEAVEDFIYTEEELASELQVYSMEEILDYIDSATDKAVEVCRSILSGFQSELKR